MWKTWEILSAKKDIWKTTKSSKTHLNIYRLVLQFLTITQSTARTNHLESPLSSSYWSFPPQPTEQTSNKWHRFLKNVKNSNALSIGLTSWAIRNVILRSPHSLRMFFCIKKQTYNGIILVTQRNEVLIHVTTTWMKLENTPSKRGQSPKASHCMNFHLVHW